MKHLKEFKDLNEGAMFTMDLGNLGPKPHQQEKPKSKLSGKWLRAMAFAMFEELGELTLGAKARIDVMLGEGCYPSELDTLTVLTSLAANVPGITFDINDSECYAKSDNEMSEGFDFNPAMKIEKWFNKNIAYFLQEEAEQEMMLAKLRANKQGIADPTPGFGMNADGTYDIQ
jgi:hypothetical protein